MRVAKSVVHGAAARSAARRLRDGRRAGSSGFDITENVIINRVLETQQCVSSERLTFCPADQKATVTPTATATPPTPTAPASPTPTPTANPTPQVDTGLADGASIACTRPQPGAPCSLLFSFSGFGFPSAASFRVASRLRAPDSAWVLAPPPALNPTADPPRLDTVVTIAVPADAGELQAQFTVLVFLSPPASVPDHFDALAESGADFAFVTPEFALEIITTGPPPTLTATPFPATPSPTPSAPTPTAASTPDLSGPLITYFGVARADSVSLAPSDSDPAGRPIFVRPFGYGLSLIVEGRPGTGSRPVGPSGYDPTGTLPDLQMILSRPLGNGSDLVCDRLPPNLGGVPATAPFAFSDAVQVVNAINDLGCRVDDGQGNPEARPATSACTLDRSGEFSFVDASSTRQFCLPIAAAWAFPAGDTIVAARLRDTAGNLGPQREIVVRNAASAQHSPTPTAPTSSPPASPTPRAPTPTLPPPTPSSAPTTPRSPPPISFTTTVTPTPTPTFTPAPGSGPPITHLGLARADDQPLVAQGNDAAGRPIYASPLGFGIVIIIEGRPDAQGGRLGNTAYSASGLPDLQMIVSRPLGNGSPIVCDTRPPLLGGVPAPDPLVFTDAPGESDAINDLGCRVDARTVPNDGGTGQGLGPCTRNANGEGAFVDSATKVQFCPALGVGAELAFPLGDTRVTARATDVLGQPGPPASIIIRILGQ